MSGYVTDGVLPKIYTEISNEYIRNEPLWFVDLSNDTRAWHMPTERSWLALKAWLIENPNVFIKSLYFQFRDHVEHIGSNKDGFFFSHGVDCWWGCSPQESFFGGYAEGNKVYRRKFIVPELISNESDEKDINDESIQLGLILRAKL